MEFDFAKMIEELKKTTVLAFVARIDGDKLYATRFIKALFDNGCPTDAVLNAVIAMADTKEESESED